VIPVFQTVFDPTHGDCFSACLASILEIPLKWVPTFCVDYPDTWFDELNEWLKYFGLRCLGSYDVACWDKETWNSIAGMYGIGGGLSPRYKNTMHAVVCQGDKIVHDPHPDNTGLKGGLVDIMILTQLDPAVGKSVDWRVVQTVTPWPDEALHAPEVLVDEYE
jgi:hypothetical protein